MNTASLFLLSNAIILGFRHGLDWDHIAAIMDIVGTSTTPTSAHTESSSCLHKRALGLSFMYALGHATVVVTLGIAALWFAAILPKWIDPVMERIVGITLLILGAWVFYSLLRFIQGEQDFELKSRWMIIFAVIRRAVIYVVSQVSGRTQPDAFKTGQYGARTAFGVGMIHGIGAETGTQVLLIAAVGGAGSHELGVGLLLAFVMGLLISNTIIAVFGSTGFVTSARLKPVYLATGLLVGLFSVLVGSYFAIGQSNVLPDLH